MEVTIRATHQSEYPQTEHLTRETFWNLYKPGCDEHLVLHNLRKSDSHVAKLDLVALHEGEIVGHIISSRARIVDPDNSSYKVLCVGPISVLPDLQNRSIGSKLIRQSILRAKKLGYAGMILFGSPDYYPSFGFKNAVEYGITTKDGQNFDAFMALELQEDGFRNIRGKFFEADAFHVNEAELTTFEKQFPPRKKGEPKIDLG